MRVFVIFLLLLGSTVAHSQEIKAKSNSTEVKSKVTTSSEGKVKVTVHENGTKTISKSNRSSRQHYSSAKSPKNSTSTPPDYQGQIKAIEKKIEWVKSNPDEHKQALESGWYDKMEQRISELESKLAKQ